jgi:hypothetical protein
MSGITRATGSTNRETTHTFIHWVKNMKDMGCQPFLRDEDAKVAG